MDNMTERDLANMFLDNRSQSYINQFEEAMQNVAYRKMCVKFDDNFTLYIYRATRGDLFDYGYHTSKRIAKEMAAEGLQKKLRQFHRFMYLRSLNLNRAAPVPIGIPSIFAPHPYALAFASNPQYAAVHSNFMDSFYGSSSETGGIPIPGSSLVPEDPPKDMNTPTDSEEVKTDNSPYPILQQLAIKYNWQPAVYDFFFHPEHVVIFCRLMHYTTYSQGKTKTEAHENSAYNMISLVENLSQLEIDTFKENPIERIPHILPQYTSTFSNGSEPFDRYKDLLIRLSRSKDSTISKINELMDKPQYSAMALLKQIGEEELFEEVYNVIYNKPSTSAIIMEVTIFDFRVNVGFGTTLPEARQVAANGVLMTFRSSIGH